MPIFALSSLFALFISLGAQAAQENIAEVAEEAKPLWEYGAGVGFIHHEQYPASDQFSEIAIPFPTFQYRGEIVRADDREGAKAYFLKGDRWYVEISGAGLPALDSKKNEAREGMESLPWMLLLGPQYVRKISDNFEVKLAGFQATSTDFMMTRFTGYNYRLRFTYKFYQDFSAFNVLQKGTTQGHVHLSLHGGSREFLANYFDVPLAFVTPKRKAYDSQGGLISYNLVFFESWTSGRASLYLGAELSRYDVSINRNSPLHRSDSNVIYFTGLTYVLGESEKRSVPVDETKGIVRKIGPWGPHAE